MPQGSVTKPYADYNWYATQYFGSDLTEVEFPRYAKQASYLVDQLTSGNLERLGFTTETLPDCVKDATCAAADILWKHQTAADNLVRSESNDGYSVTYADAGTAQQATAKATLEIRRYLSNTGLLYRGVYHPPKKETQGDD